MLNPAYAAINPWITGDNTLWTLDKSLYEGRDRDGGREGWGGGKEGGPFVNLSQYIQWLIKMEKLLHLMMDSCPCDLQETSNNAISCYCAPPSIMIVLQKRHASLPLC